MMRKEPISTAAAPAAIGPYSQAVEQDGWLFLSGQIGLDPASGVLVAGGVEAEARQVLANLSAVLAAAGVTLADVLRTTVYLTDLADFPLVNEIYGQHFPAPFPARSTIGVASLPRGARVEIDLIAHRRSDTAD